MLFVFVLSIILVWIIVLQRCYSNSYNYWKKKGVPFPKPVLFCGNLGESVTLRKHIGQIYQDIYNSFRNDSYVGFYKLREPAILIREPELIERVLIKDFDSFRDNSVEVDSDVDPILARNPFFLKGHKWKVIRSQVSAALTNGKIKHLHYLMRNIGKNLIAYLNNKPVGRHKEGIDAKELSEKFMADVVAACAFGRPGKSFMDENAEFRTMGRKLLSPTLSNALKITLVYFCPVVSRLLKIPLLPKEVSTWFSRVFDETVAYRTDHNIHRDDYFDLMMSINDFTEAEAKAQLMTLFADGFETSSVALCYTLYEIAANAHVQQKLQKEIDSVVAKYYGDVTFEAIQDMDYLDAVLFESLRLHTPVLFLDKRCTRPYNLSPAKEKGTTVHISLGTTVIIPVYALHMDPKYFPEPELFDPERFSEKNKLSIIKCSFLPFGDGPRKCLGSRFATAEVKTAIVSVLMNYYIQVNPKTKVPLKINPRSILMNTKDGLWLNFYKRPQ